MAVSLAWLTLSAFIVYLTLVGFDNLEAERNGDWYVGLAVNLVQRQEFRNCDPVDDGFQCQTLEPKTAYQLPGYPVYLAANFVLFGMENPIPAIRLLSGVLASMLVFMTTLLAARISDNDVVGLVAGVALFLNPWLYYLGGLLITDFFFTFLLFVFVVVLKGVRNPATAFVAGLILGATFLTRSVLLFALPILFAFGMEKKYIPVLCAGLVLVLLPWIVRNALVFDAFVPFSTVSGVVMWCSNNPIAYGIDPLGIPSGRCLNPFIIPGSERYLDFGEIERDRAMRQEAIAFITSTPLLLVARASIAKFISLLGLNLLWVGREPSLVSVFSSLVRLEPIVVLLVWPVIFIRSFFSASIRESLGLLVKERAVVIMLAIIFAIVLNTLMFYGSTRFRFPIDPFLAILSALGFAILVEGGSGQRTGAEPVRKGVALSL